MTEWKPIEGCSNTEPHTAEEHTPRGESPLTARSPQKTADAFNRDHMKED